MSSNNKTHSIIKIISLTLVLLLLSTAAGAGGAYMMLESQYGDNAAEIFSSTDASQVAEGNPIKQNTSSENSSILTGSDIYELALKQVVAVKSTSTTENVFGQETTSATSGTGFVISDTGYIMTNYHVIEYSVLYGYDLSVIFSDGNSYPAEVIGYYADNDIAIIHIDAEGLSAVKLGNSDDMQVGETVYCVGNPLGELDFTMTSGIVSALDRAITTDAYTSINMFQFDAAVNAGNSGGPVFDSYGNVIGIVTAKYSDEGVEGLGFAIPINDAIGISSDLIEYGYVTGRASLGISAKDVEPYVSQYYSIPKGVYVHSVDEGSCADEAGITAGDVITAIGDTDIESVDELKTQLKNYSAGDSVRLTVYRSNEYITLDITFDEQHPKSDDTDSSVNESSQQASSNSNFSSSPFKR